MENPAVLVAQIVMEELTTEELNSMILCQYLNNDPTTLGCWQKASPLYAGMNRLHDVIFDAVNDEIVRREAIK